MKAHTFQAVGFKRQPARPYVTGRLQDFLRYVKYRSPHDELTYRQGLANGDSEVIYPALKFVLSAVERNEKRAYVGYYLDRIEIPAEYQQDEEIMELMHQSEDLKQQFAQTHTEVEEMRKTFKDPASVKVGRCKLDPGLTPASKRRPVSNFDCEKDDSAFNLTPTCCFLSLLAPLCQGADQSA